MNLFRHLVYGCIGIICTQAATVNFTQSAVNDVDGSTIGAVASNQFLETGNSYSTLTAPASFTNFNFTHWTNNSESTATYRDTWGRSVNPISFVLLEATTTTAHYLPATRNTDGDSLPDWYEIEYFGNLNRTNTDDGDGDGTLLLAEFTGGTHPLFGNNSSEGGIAFADSGLVSVNLAGYARYTLRSEPAGTVNQTAVVPTATVVTTPDLSSELFFSYWYLDGVRQEDDWGVALRQISFTVTDSDRTAVAHLLANDSDGDNLNDGLERYFYGSLANGADFDGDGDEIPLLAELAAGTSPIFGNSHQPGGRHFHLGWQWNGFRCGRV